MDTKERGWIVSSFRSQYNYDRCHFNSSEKINYFKSKDICLMKHRGDGLEATLIKRYVRDFST